MRGKSNVLELIFALPTDCIVLILEKIHGILYHCRGWEHLIFKFTGTISKPSHVNAESPPTELEIYNKKIYYWKITVKVISGRLHWCRFLKDGKLCFKDICLVKTHAFTFNLFLPIAFDCQKDLRHNWTFWILLLPVVILIPKFMYHIWI